MPHPTKKATKVSRRTRASHFALSKKQLTVCKNCESMKKPHEICSSCGAYQKRKK